MQFEKIILNDAYLVHLQPRQDERGFFARTFCSNEFAQMGLKTVMVQSNTSYSAHKHTLRGMHFQIEDAAEVKLIRCIRGRILDVIIDIRPESSTYLKHYKVELTQDNHRLLYVPEGFAHGYITLEEHCEVFYQVSNFYSPTKERGIRWNDPLFDIEWPTSEPRISPKDAIHPDFKAI